MVAKVVIRLPFEPVVRVSLDCSGSDDKAKQSFKDECDVNTIVRRYEMGGELPEFRGEPLYADVSGIEFQAMMDVVASAQAAFEALPAEVRRRFGNDPREFVAFVGDPSNRAEARKLGLTRERKSDSIDPAAMKRRIGDQDGTVEGELGVGSDGVKHVSRGARSSEEQGHDAGDRAGDQRADHGGASASGARGSGRSGSGGFRGVG